ncbi:hypothetical protein [Mesorhizobium sp. WSM3860]|uniref:hypothetical protein n=1 Tax=Mesorhizobium sp. WSM3860 TaxID=2029403 RepID=UPI001FDF340A|nr:hypothetical protein [Mesorhizobium sp. WSM3860]
MKPIIARCYFEEATGFAALAASRLEGLDMSRTTLVAIAFLVISIGPTEAKGHKVSPVCTASSSLSEVLHGKCFLVKGSMIYGDIADLSQIVQLGW